ncbi:MAG: M24 family metallopeptidase [Candidatus Thorarchaeota archaeon]
MREYEERVKNLQLQMSKDEIDAIVIMDLANYVYYTGDLRKQPRAFIPQEGNPALLVFRGESESLKQASWIKDVRPYTAVHEMIVAIINLLKEHGCEEGTVGLHMDFSLPAFLYERFKLANPTVSVVDASDTLIEMRLTKSPSEIELMRKAQEIAAKGMDTAQEFLRPGVSEQEVLAEITYTMRREGASGFGFEPFVNSGERSQGLHGVATDRVVQHGDPVLIDVSPMYRGYHGNLTRVLNLGPPSQGLVQVSEAYDHARKAAMDAARPGVKVMQLDNAFYGALKEHGMGDYQIRGIAHGIGLNFEEKPFSTIFPEHMMVRLREDMVLSFGHPILWVPGKGAARIEDVFHLTSEGPEQLVEYDSGIIGVD